MNLEDLKVYQLAMALGEKVWDIVIQLNKDIELIGKKLNAYIKSIGK